MWDVIASSCLAVTFLPRYREDIVRRDVSRHRCSRIRRRASRRECSHLRRRELRRRLALPDDDATGITRLAKVDMNLLHIRSERTRIGQRMCDRSLLFIQIQVERARGVGQDRPGVAGGRGRVESRHGDRSRYRSDFVEPAQARRKLVCMTIACREGHDDGGQAGLEKFQAELDVLSYLLTDCASTLPT